jgi:hypothetical protein
MRRSGHRTTRQASKAGSLLKLFFPDAGGTQGHRPDQRQNGRAPVTRESSSSCDILPCFHCWRLPAASRSMFWMPIGAEACSLHRLTPIRAERATSPVPWRSITALLNSRSTRQSRARAVSAAIPDVADARVINCEPAYRDNLLLKLPPRCREIVPPEPPARQVSGEACSKRSKSGATV